MLQVLGQRGYKSACASPPSPRLGPSPCPVPLSLDDAPRSPASPALTPRPQRCSCGRTTPKTPTARRSSTPRTSTTASSRATLSRISCSTTPRSRRVSHFLASLPGPLPHVPLGRAYVSLRGVGIRTALTVFEASSQLLPYAVPKLEAAGYQIVAVDTCLGSDGTSSPRHERFETHDACLQASGRTSMSRSPGPGTARGRARETMRRRTLTDAAVHTPLDIVL